MIDRRYKRLTAFLVITVFAAVLGAAAFTAVDVSAEAEPSWLEKRLASVLLDMKLRANRPTKLSPFTPTEQDIEKGSDIYREQCAICHGATRGRIAPLGKSFSPRPPQFVIEPAHGPTWMDAYVIQHGVRWSGMPAFRKQTLGESLCMSKDEANQKNDDERRRLTTVVQGFEASSVLTK